MWALNSIPKDFPHIAISVAVNGLWSNLQPDGLASWYTASPENAMVMKSLQTHAFGLR